MLVIRDEQLRSFIERGEDDLLVLVCEAVISANPERVSAIRPERMVSMVKLGIDKARAAGIDLAEDIAAFVALMFEISPGFDQQSSIAAVLADTNFPVGERLSQLAERVPDEAWDEAVAGYDEHFWFQEQDS
jgi:hypothetical protein